MVPPEVITAVRTYYHRLPAYALVRPAYQAAVILGLTALRRSPAACSAAFVAWAVDACGGARFLIRRYPVRR
jgi:hypothetical protein